jgi:hypothetical protein
LTVNHESRLQQFWARKFYELLPRLSLGDAGTLIVPALGIANFAQTSWTYCPLKSPPLGKLSSDHRSTRKFGQLGDFRAVLEALEALPTVSLKFGRDDLREFPSSEFLKRFAPGNRREAYDQLLPVAWPSNVRSASAVSAFPSRDQLDFPPYISFPEDVADWTATAYYLDHIAFPFASFALWPVCSFQPQAGVIFFSESPEVIRPEWKSSASQALQFWEAEVIAELYSLRMAEFLKRLAQTSRDARSRDQERRGEALRDAAQMLFQFVDIDLRGDASSQFDWWPLQPKPNEPRLLFETPSERWSALVRANDAVRYDLLLEHMHDLLTTACDLFDSAVEREWMRPAEELFAFMAGEKGKHFRDGLQKLEKATDAFVADEFAGKDLFVRLADALREFIDRADLHEVFRSVTKSRDLATAVASSPEVATIVEKLVDILASKGLPATLLAPLKEGTSTCDSHGFPASVGLLKAIVGGAVWLPWLSLLASAAATAEPVKFNLDLLKLARYAVVRMRGAQRAGDPAEVLGALWAFNIVLTEARPSEISVNEVPQHSIALKQLDKVVQLLTLTDALNNASKQRSRPKPGTQGLTRAGHTLAELTDRWTSDETTRALTLFLASKYNLWYMK